MTRRRKITLGLGATLLLLFIFVLFEPFAARYEGKTLKQWWGTYSAISKTNSTSSVQSEVAAVFKQADAGGLKFLASKLNSTVQTSGLYKKLWKLGGRFSQRYLPDPDQPNPSRLRAIRLLAYFGSDAKKLTPSYQKILSTGHPIEQELILHQLQTMGILDPKLRPSLEKISTTGGAEIKGLAKTVLRTQFVSDEATTSGK